MLFSFLFSISFFLNDSCKNTHSQALKKHKDKFDILLHKHFGTFYLYPIIKECNIQKSLDIISIKGVVYSEGVKLNNVNIYFAIKRGKKLKIINYIGNTNLGSFNLKILKLKKKHISLKIVWSPLYNLEGLFIRI